MRRLGRRSTTAPSSLEQAALPGRVVAVAARVPSLRTTRWQGRMHGQLVARHDAAHRPMGMRVAGGDGQLAVAHHRPVRHARQRAASTSASKAVRFAQRGVALEVERTTRRLAVEVAPQTGRTSRSRLGGGVTAGTGREARDAPAGRRRARACRPRRRCSYDTSSRRSSYRPRASPRLVETCVDLACHLARQPGHPFDLVATAATKRSGLPKCSQDAAAAHGPDARAVRRRSSPP